MPGFDGRKVWCPRMPEDGGLSTSRVTEGRRFPLRSALIPRPAGSSNASRRIFRFAGAAIITQVRISEERSWVTATALRGSFSRTVIHGTIPLRSITLRGITAPGSPVSQSDRLSIRSDRLNCGLTGYRASVAPGSKVAEGLCAAT